MARDDVVNRQLRLRFVARLPRQREEIYEAPEGIWTEPEEFQPFMPSLTKPSPEHGGRCSAMPRKCLVINH